MVVILKITAHSCPQTGMLYPYPSKICQWCSGVGIDLRMTRDEMYRENLRRRFEQKLNADK